jgi:cytochrome c2
MDMKLIINILGGIVLLLIVIVLSVYFYLSSSGIPSYEPQEITFEVDYSEEALDRGTKLVSMACAHCHSNPETGLLTGRRVEDIDPVFGNVYSQNITQDKEHGIGKWSDEDLVRMLKTGVRPDGSYAPPYMPKYPIMSNQDISAIINFLRSDARQVQASSEEPPSSEPSFMTIALCNVAFGPYEYKSISHPDTSDQIQLGKYLSTAVLGCFQCHSADFKTNNELKPELSAGYFGGGNKLYDLDGNPVLSPNITMDEETGIGLWTEQEFIDAVRFGRVKDRKPLAYPMLPYSSASEKEIKAIYAYLKTLKPISNKVALEM